VTGRQATDSRPGPIGRLLYLGNVVIDLVLTVPALPERGGDVLASSSRASPGGGFNVMAAAARQGLAVAYGGAHGSGPFADLARSGLAAEGISVLLAPAASPDTGVVVSITDSGGERTFVTSPGAEARLTAGDLATVTAGPRDAVALSGYSLLYPGNRSALLGWLPRLDAASLLVVDPGPLAGQIPAAALAAVRRRADWLTCNAREAAILTGQADPPAAARALSGPASRGAPAGPAAAAPAGGPAASPAASPAGPAGQGVIVRTGSDGCLISRGGGEPVHVPGFPVTTIDTNGAGDAHTGAFLAALARGAGEIEAARLANAAAAYAVTLPGPATAPTAAELARFLAGRS
jgi:sugar/nucleoside kinase (ribokinase family)